MVSVKKCVIYLFALFLLASCGNNKGKSISKLDRQKGFNGLVLGDSTYNNFIQKVKNEANDDEIIERKIFGNVIVPAQNIENLDHRFVYGILMPNFFVAALNGKIYSYTLTNTNSDSTSQRKLLDSLKTNYGEPDISKDTSYVIDSYPIMVIPDKLTPHSGESDPPSGFDCVPLWL